jgi:hypothetical protein
MKPMSDWHLSGNNGCDIYPVFKKCAQQGLGPYGDTTMKVVTAVTCEMSPKNPGPRNPGKGLAIVETSQQHYWGGQLE